MMPAMPEAAGEAVLLRELGGRGAEAEEAVRSLAVGAVVRGRLTPTDAAALSPFTAAELEPLSTDATAVASPPAPLLSAVVPAFNEEENLDDLWARCVRCSTRSGTASWSSSTTAVPMGPGPASCACPRPTRGSGGLRLTRNFGHQAALSAGMAHARGQTVAFLDADLQDPPELLLDFLEQWRAGNQVVYAIRRSRKEGAAKQLAYRAFYRFYRRIANIDVPVDSGDFALLDRRVVDDMLSLPEHNRFLRGLRSWVGYRQVGVEYDRDARNAGAPKYTARRLVRLAVDGLLSFSASPLRLASYLGILIGLAGGVYIAVAIIYRLFVGDVPEGWTSIIAVILTVGGHAAPRGGGPGRVPRPRLRRDQGPPQLPRRRGGGPPADRGASDGARPSTRSTPPSSRTTGGSSGVGP